MTPDPHQIAASLTAARRQYLEAVDNSDQPYQPRHHQAANWALRCRYVDTVMSVDGMEMLGQVLTPLGQQVRHILKGYK